MMLCTCEAGAIGDFLGIRPHRAGAAVTLDIAGARHAVPRYVAGRAADATGPAVIPAPFTSRDRRARTAAKPRVVSVSIAARAHGRNGNKRPR